MAKDKSKNQDILDIIQGISQVLANTHDGAKDKEGEPIKIGLKREEGNPVIDSRIMDGFGASIQGDKLIIKYHSEILLSDVHDKKFEDNIESMIEDISKYIKKEYKTITGNTLSLSKVKKPPMKAIVQRASNVRCWVEAQCAYEIGGMDFNSKDEKQKDWRNNFEDWLKQSEQKPKKPSNVKIKEKDNEKDLK
jgi:hypothetical protein